VPVEDPRSREYLYNHLEFHPPWMRDSLDLVSWGGGDAHVSQQGTKPAGRDQGLSTKGFPFISISVQLLTLVVTQGRIFFIIFAFIVDVVVFLVLCIWQKLLTCLVGFDELHCIINYRRPIETLPEHFHGDSSCTFVTSAYT
jgi:hypothetical protein